MLKTPPSVELSEIEHGGGEFSRSTGDWHVVEEQLHPHPAEDLSGPEAVTAAKKARISLSQELVYKVRGRALAKKTGLRAPTFSKPTTVRATAPATGDARDSRPMTFRGALRQMLHSAVNDYGVAVERRLVALLTEEVGAARGVEAPAPRAPESRSSTRPTTATATKVKKRATRTKVTAKTPTAKAPARSVAQDDHSYRPRILSALEAAPVGLSRAQLIRVLELKPSEEMRFGTALVALRGSKSVVMDGTKRNAVYRTTPWVP